jgi:hydroxymethylpyrimidine/phosphomethylpyrimidine kinase
MAGQRPFAVSIAGLDPSAGAGILADIKCFEQHRVYGFGICTALTVQTDSDFISNEWLGIDKIIAQLEPLVEKFRIMACKIGLIKDLPELEHLIRYLRRKTPDIKIVVDPILEASAGYSFHNWGNILERMHPVLHMIDLLTPNYPEMEAIGGRLKVEEAAKIWSGSCPILLKGGHNSAERGTDYLFEGEEVHAFRSDLLLAHAKHGSGCVLSASVTANLALGHSVFASCGLAKTYINHFLNSHKSPLGYHSL